MRLAVLAKLNEPFSFRNYRENVLARLGANIEVMPFSESESIPDGCDIVWDPGMGLAKIPKVLRHAVRSSRGVPIVVTMHGVRAFSMPASELAAGIREHLHLAVTKLRRRREWRRFGRGVAKVIGVSDFGAGEVVRAFGLPQHKVTSIHHGVDHEIFKPGGESKKRDRSYFLHVSSYQRKKNIERLLSVYDSLDAAGRPDLVLVCPGAPQSFGQREGVILMEEGLSATELAPWYRGALGFLFPSLHETFGMPILEAMACGCPVLTSGTTACAEVAGSAALLVDPRDDASMRGGLERLMLDEQLRDSLTESGLVRAAGFDWQTCAERHLEILHEVAGDRR